MRLNKNTYPAYIELENSNYEMLRIDHMFGEYFNNSREKFNSFINSLISIHKQAKKKYYITESFKDAIITALPKIVEKNNQLNNIPTDCGIIFNNKGFTIYISNPSDKKLKLCLYGFTRDTITSFAYVDNDFNYGGISCSMKDGKPYDDKENTFLYIHSFLTTLYFIHNCEIEQRIIKPNQKDRSNGQRHFNESKSDITILDCRWFTELIRDTPFAVRGHLRWQVHGENRGKRKLIWIDEFEKSGYHRKQSKEISQ
jgi:hypothetical protein